VLGVSRFSCPLTRGDWGDTSQSVKESHQLRGKHSVSLSQSSTEEDIKTITTSPVTAGEYRATPTISPQSQTSMVSVTVI